MQDNDNLRAEKSISGQDLANNLVINYGIDLPFGHGQTYLSSISGAANAVIGGWRVNGITTFRSGTPIALISGQGNVLTTFGIGTYGILRPNYTAGCNKSAPGSPHSAARANQWFNTSCFTQPGSYAMGNEPRVDPTMKSEGEDNFDVSINKSFDLMEQTKLKFSAEIFDLFNHAQFALPNPTLSSPGFGQVGHQLNLPRTIQLSLRLSF